MRATVAHEGDEAWRRKNSSGSNVPQGRIAWGSSNSSGKAALAPPTNKTHQKNYGVNADEESSSWVPTSQAGREVVAWLLRWPDRVLGLTGRDRGCCVRLQGAPTCYGSAWVVDRSMKTLGWLDSVAGEVGA